MYISYDDYRVFYYAAKYENLTQAAELLLSSQPNVTRSIRRLEDQLGVRLFARSNRGVQLTPEGEKLYARVSVAMEQLQLGEEELARHAVELGAGNGLPQGLNGLEEMHEGSPAQDSAVP